MALCLACIAIYFTMSTMATFLSDKIGSGGLITCEIEAKS